MEAFFSKLFDLRKLPARMVALVFVVSSVFLFSPADLQQRLQIKGVHDQYKTYVGLAFVASACLLVLDIAIWGCKQVGSAFSLLRWRRELRRELTELDREQIIILREFILRETKTLKLPIDQPAVAGLIRRGFLEILGQVGYPGRDGLVFPVRLDPELEKILLFSHLKLPDNASLLTEQDWIRIRTERPRFLRDIESF